MAELILLQLSKITLLEHNPRAIEESDIDQLCQDIEEDPEFLKQRPPLINQKGKQYICYAGQQRVKACIKLGLKEIYVFMEKNVPKKVQDKRMVLDNTHRGRWDIKVLMNEYDFKVEELVGFGIPETSFNVYGKGEATEDDYQIPDEIQTNIKLGDLIEIGTHRLLCGDSTIAEDVKKLMGGAMADMVFIDPPYGIDYSGGRTHGKIAGDKKQGVELGKLLTHVFYHNKQEADIYICASPIMQKPFLDFITFSEKVVDAVIVWDKQNPGLGYMAYRRQTEFIFFIKGAPFRKGDKSDFDLWSISKGSTQDYEHGAQKPVALPARAIENSSKKDDIVLDYFLGSGTTMVACQQLERICYAIEIEPKYCQVVIDRMLKSFPELEVKVNGKKYKEISAK